MIPLPVPIEDPFPVVLVLVEDPLPVVLVQAPSSPSPVQVNTERPPITQVYTHRRAPAPPPVQPSLTDLVVALPPSELDLSISLRKGSPYFFKVATSNGRGIVYFTTQSHVGTYYSPSR
ncbi:PREDICTED: uncharacterized protein LOC104592154 [Nelumbo nucifera]|uniref:Uncharacterized protein LOC104592154 n=1 Tax=Nelumbo nucifera TaxID=4432 RepID=A0A1U7ZAL1_NELNU|nr:PREDICTED: uncharacterized protein LOC104592154 [Nelumbo nucifera]